MRFRLIEMKEIKSIASYKKKMLSETVQLEKLVIKTASLLTICFGEAGSEIIAYNLRKGEIILSKPSFFNLIFRRFCRPNDSWEKYQRGVWVLRYP